MPAKEIKIALKEVREAIKNKDNQIAIRKCDEILLEEPKNYMALVLMGAAYQENDKKEAAKYLRRAVDSSAGIDPIIALQGLANCAEIDELPNIYRQLLKLLPEKYPEYHLKIVNISSNNKNLEDCIEILETETKIEHTESNVQRIKSAFKYLAKILIKISIPDKWQNLLKPSLAVAIEDENCELHLEFMKRFLKQLYKLNEFEELIKNACIMTEKYPQEIYPLEWICKIYSENDLNFQDILIESIEFYVDRLLKLESNSISGILVKSLLYFRNKEFILARDYLLQIKGITTNLGMELLGKCYMEIGSYNMAINIFRNIKINDKLMAECLSYSNNQNSLKEGLDLLKNFDKNDVDVLLCLARIYYNSEDKENLLKILEHCKTINCNKETLTMLEANYSKTPEEAIILLENLLSDNFQIELIKGKLFLQLKQFEKSLNSLLKATKLKPFKYECFLNLGLLYFSIGDLIRTKKCFEKCINLNPYCDEALKHLCGIYRKNEEWEQNGLVLEKVINQLPTNHATIPLFQQGLHFMCTKNYDDAIHSLRTALRYDLTNIMYWEALGDSYRERGSYNSSMKVYQKILEINPENVYAKLQIACLKIVLRQYKDAIVCFDELLKEQSDYLPALKGAAEAHYSMANSLLPQQLLGRAKEHFQIAINHLQKVFLIGKDKMIWAWRLTANIFVAVACMPKSKANLKVFDILNGHNEENVILERKDLFELAIKYYTCALKLHSEDTFLWQELSICAYYYAKMPNQNVDNEIKYLSLSQKACKSSIKCQSNRWQTWNLLGVLYSTKYENQKLSNYSLAQHYFIKGLLLDKKSAMLWTNLGVLYLQSNEIKLANQCFNRAQQSDPTYINTWIGQAMIAEKIAENEEAMDLFRHCTQLNFHRESAIGYANWVCTILSDEKLMTESHFKYAIENMHALTLATDCMTWYLNIEDDMCNINALSYFGYLNARQNLWSVAIRAFRTAVEKCIESDNIQHKDKMLFNLGYCYLKNNCPEDAVKIFSQITEATLKSTVGLALAYSKCEQYQESYSVYSSALEWLTATDKEKAEILVAMSSMVYSFQGEEDTKTILYQCMSLENRPIQALYSACALGIIHHDFQLAETVLDELKNFENDLEHSHHVAYLTAQFYLANKQPKQALHHLLSKVHIYPNRTLLRKVLANFLVNNFSKTTKYSKGACQIAQSIINLGHRSSTRYNSLDYATCLLTASEAIKNVDKVKQRKLIQQAIHLHPVHKLAWKALASC